MLTAVGITVVQDRRIRSDSSREGGQPLRGLASGYFGLEPAFLEFLILFREDASAEVRGGS